MMPKISAKFYDKAKLNYLWNVVVLTQRLEMRVKFINTVFMCLIRKFCHTLRELQSKNVNI
jgi:hypothetical protein